MRPHHHMARGWVSGWEGARPCPACPGACRAPRLPAAYVFGVSNSLLLAHSAFPSLPLLVFRRFASHVDTRVFASTSRRALLSLGVYILYPLLRSREGTSATHRHRQTTTSSAYRHYCPSRASYAFLSLMEAHTDTHRALASHYSERTNTNTHRTSTPGTGPTTTTLRREGTDERVSHPASRKGQGRQGRA